MKSLLKNFSTILLCVLCSNTIMANDNLKSLWKAYENAIEKGLVSTASNTLEQIKKTALEQKSYHDFYKAGLEYIQVNRNINWKRAQELEDAWKKEILDLDEPIVSFIAGSYHGTNEIVTVLKNKKEKLQREKNEKLWEFKRFSSQEVRILQDFISNDYEFILLNTYFENKNKSNSSKSLSDLFIQKFGETHPFNTLDYYWSNIANLKSKDLPKIEKYIEEHPGLAVTAMAENQILRIKQKQLNYKDSANSTDYLQLKEEAVRVQKFIKTLPEKEKLLLKYENYPNSLIRELTSKSINLSGDEEKLTIFLRNISGVNLTIKDSASNFVLKETIENKKKSFYIIDTLQYSLPKLKDGRYIFEVEENGKFLQEKIKDETELNIRSISLANQIVNGECLIYASDRISGKPLEDVEIEFLFVKNYDENNVKILGRKKLHLNALTTLPLDIYGKFLFNDRLCFRCRRLNEKSNYDYSNIVSFSKYQLESSKDRKIRQITLNNYVKLLLDVKAVRPGDKINFKAIVYKYSNQLRPSTVENAFPVEVLLIDSKGNTVAKQDLSTNQFGSVSGSFNIPSDHRRGEWCIAVCIDGTRESSEYFTVDDFKLPSYTIDFQEDKTPYKPGDTIPIKGKVTAYSGNSLSDAKLEYSVFTRGNVIKTGLVEIKKDRTFHFDFESSHKESSTYYNIKLKLTDGAGQSLEFSTSRTISDYLNISVELENKAEGICYKRESSKTSRWSNHQSLAILDDETARFKISLSSYNTILEDAITYSLKQNNKEIKSGKALSTNKLEIDMGNYPSGIYELMIKYKSGTKTLEFIKQDNNDSQIDKSIDFFVKINEKIKGGINSGINETDSGISFKLGSGDTPIWTLMTVYDINRKILKNEVLYLNGGEDACSVNTFSYCFEENWSSKVLLKLLCFKNGEYYSFEHEYDKTVQRLFKPLSISSFTDKCTAKTEYSVLIRCEKDSEILASIFDKSIEDIRKNNWSALQPLQYKISIFESVLCGSFSWSWNYSHSNDDILRVYAAEGAMSTKSLSQSMLCERTSISEDTSSDRVVSEEWLDYSEDGLESHESENQTTTIRKDFSTVLCFEPNLQTNSNGEALLNFKTSDKLSTFILALFAHDKNMNNAALRQSFIVSQNVIITLHEPSLLYDNDLYRLRASISNTSDENISGIVNLSSNNLVQKQNLELKAGVSKTVEFILSAANTENLDLKLVYNAKDSNGKSYSDGVYTKIPVYTSKQTITEAYSAILKPGMDRNKLIEDLEKQFVNTSHFGAELKERTVEEMLNEVLSENSIAKSDNVIDLVDALYACFYQNNISQACEKLSYTEKTHFLEKILLCQNSDGGFAWFKNMSSSTAVTMYVLKRLVMMPQIVTDRNILIRALKYLDSEYKEMEARPYWYGHISFEELIYIHSFFPEISTKALDRNKVRNYLLGKNSKDDLRHSSANLGNLHSKVIRACTLLNLYKSKNEEFVNNYIMFLTSYRLKKQIQRSINSLKEYAVEHKGTGDSKGLYAGLGAYYYPNLVMPFRAILTSEAYTHALVAQLLLSWNQIVEDAEAVKIAEGINLWLIIQKDTQKWSTKPEYIDACNSILSSSEAFLQTSIISLSKSVLKEFNEIKSSGNGFSIDRKYYKLNSRNEQIELSEGDKLEVGDKIIAKYNIHNDENRSFVLVTAPYPACFRPENQLSGHFSGGLRFLFNNIYYTSQAYREVMLDKIQYYFDVYPEENSSIEECFYVSQAGEFTTPVCEVESLYATHYRANSESWQFLSK